MSEENMIVWLEKVEKKLDKVINNRAMCMERFGRIEARVAIVFGVLSALGIAVIGLVVKFLAS